MEYELNARAPKSSPRDVAETFRLAALECVSMAHETKDSAAWADLLRLAKHWGNLAEQAKNEFNDKRQIR